MKLNYRDKIILTVVIVALVWVAGIMLFIKPAIEDVQAANDKLDDAKATLSDLEAQVEADKDLDERIAQAYDEVTVLASNFYDYQETQQATQVVDDLLKSDEIVNADMKISAYSVTTLAPYVYSSGIISTDMDNKVEDYANAEVAADAEGTEGDAANQNAATAQTATDTAKSLERPIGCYEISFDFTGKIDDVKQFCEKLKSNTEKTLILEELSLEFESDEEGNVSTTDVEGSMSLKMVVLKKLENPDNV